MNIVVLVKQVPDPEAYVEVVNDGAAIEIEVAVKRHTLTSTVFISSLLLQCGELRAPAISPCRRHTPARCELQDGGPGCSNSPRPLSACTFHSPEARRAKGPAPARGAGVPARETARPLAVPAPAVTTGVEGSRQPWRPANAKSAPTSTPLNATCDESTSNSTGHYLSARNQHCFLSAMLFRAGCEASRRGACISTAPHRGRAQVSRAQSLMPRTPNVKYNARRRAIQAKCARSC